MKKLYVVAFLLIVAMVGNVFAQERTITGTVTSADDGMELPGASVVIPGTQQGTVTDVSGRYSLSVPEGTTQLEYSFVGMKPILVSIVGLNTVDVVLEMQSMALNEVVVTSLGISRERKSLGYAVSEVSGDEVSTVKETNVINSLAGRVSGVNITQSTSGPGGGTRVIIRGNNSLSGNNQPLYVIDGIPMDNSGFGGANGGGAGEYSRRDGGTGVSDINPDDVESISVLKGPNAAALYGSRAANGVILITTKKGSARKGVGVTLTSNVMFDTPLLLPEYQNKYGQGSSGDMPNDYADLETFKTNGGSWGGEMDGSSQMYWVEDPLGSGNPIMRP
ncbi:MAG: TonB-dependent receptor plug domain-containing protein [Bacteroidales bacterium]|nr:TonB-dependent receptor plug domain-containing protein [Bacteroidales bacterium]